ncbi:MAG: phosphatase PAP2 family protein [bacterium]
MAGFEAAASPTFPRWLTTSVRGAFWYVIDMTVFVGLFFVYFFGRGLPHDRVPLATKNAFHVIDLERSLGVFREPAWQQAAMKQDHLVDLANFTYLNLHMPLLVALGFAFFLADSRKHRLIRNTILLSAFLAIPIYMAFPVTPPRLMGSAGYPIGIFDTIPEAVRSKPGPLANWYAAVPSYHFGWISLAVAGVWWTWKQWLVRAAAVAFGGLMWWSIVVTGNHYFTDMLAGVAMVSLSFRLVLGFERWTEAHPDQVGRFTVRLGPLRLPF